MKERISAWIKDKRTLIGIYGASILFILLCVAGVCYERPWIAYSVFVLIGIYLICMKTAFCLYLLAFITPLSVNISEKIPDVAFNMSIPSEPLLICLMLLFLWEVLWKKHYPKEILRHPVSIALYIYIAWLCITACFSTLPMISFKHLLSKLWFILPCYFFLAEQIYQDRRNALRFLFCYALGLCTVVCITTVKHIQLGAIEKVAYWVMSPYYNDHTAYGAILVFFSCILPGFIFNKEVKPQLRKIAAVMLCIVLTGLYLSFSRAAWLSLVIAVGVFFLALWRIKFRNILIVSACIAAFIGFFADDILYKLNKNESESSQNLVEHLQSMSNISTDASNVERINRWTSAIEMFKQRPFLGWGPGTYQFQYAPFQNPRYKTIITTNSGDGGNAHSEYLGLMAETGFPGPLVLLVLIACSLTTGLKVFHDCRESAYARIVCCVCVLALVSYFTHGFFNNFLDTEKLAVPVFGSMAVLSAMDAKRTKAKI